LSHFSADELFGFLADKKIGTLVLNHLAPEYAGSEAKIAEQAARALPQVRRVIVPKDGEKIDF
jgi:ribonuclease BN (tRNA processing enzyme)